MRAVDTNVLVRIVTRDDEKQVESADAFIERGAWVSHLVLAEAIWVLRSTFGLDHARIATVIEMLDSPIASSSKSRVKLDTSRWVHSTRN